MELVQGKDAKKLYEQFGFGKTSSSKKSDEKSESESDAAESEAEAAAEASSADELPQIVTKGIDPVLAELCVDALIVQSWIKNHAKLQLGNFCCVAHFDRFEKLRTDTTAPHYGKQTFAQIEDRQE